MTNDDVVSRQAVLKQLKCCLTGGETEYQYVKLHIDSIPSARPQEPTACDIDKAKSEIADEVSKHYDEWSYVAGLMTAKDIFEKHLTGGGMSEEVKAHYERLGKYYNEGGKK